MSSNYVQYLEGVYANIDRRAESLKKSGKWKASDKKHIEDKINKVKHEIKLAINTAAATKEIVDDSFVVNIKLDDKIRSIENLSNEITNEYNSMESSSSSSYLEEDLSGQKTQKVGELIVNITEKPREFEFVANKETDLFSSSIPANITIAADPYKEDYMKNYGVTANDIDYLKLREKKAEDDVKLFIATEQGKKIFGDDLKDSHIILKNLFLDKSIDVLLKKPIIEIIKKFKLEDALIVDYSFNGYASELDGYYAYDGKIATDLPLYSGKDYLISKIIFKLLSCAKYDISPVLHIVKYKTIPSTLDRLKNNYPHIEVRVIDSLIKSFINNINDMVHTTYFEKFVIFILALFHKASSEETKNLRDADVTRWYNEIMSTYVNNNNTYKKYKEIYGKYQVKNNSLNDMYLMQELTYPPRHDYSFIIPHEYRCALLTAGDAISYTDIGVVGITRKTMPAKRIIDYVPADEAKLHEGLLKEEQKKLLQELNEYHIREEANLLTAGNTKAATDALKAEQVNHLQNNIYLAQIRERPRGTHRDDYNALRTNQVNRIKATLVTLKRVYNDLKPPRVLHLVELEILHKKFVKDLKATHVANRTEMKLDVRNASEIKIANHLEDHQLQEANILIDLQKLEDPTNATPPIADPVKTDYDTLRGIQSSVIQHNIAMMKNKHYIRIPLEILGMQQTKAEQKQQAAIVTQAALVAQNGSHKNNARLLHAQISLKRLSLQKHITNMLANKSELLEQFNKLEILNGRNITDAEAKILLASIKLEEKNTNDLAEDNIDAKATPGNIGWSSFKTIKQVVHTLIDQGIQSEDGKIQAANQATRLAITNTIAAVTTAEASKTAVDIQTANAVLALAQAASATEVTAIQVLQHIINNALTTTLAQAQQILAIPNAAQAAPLFANVIPPAPVANVIPQQVNQNQPQAAANQLALDFTTFSQIVQDLTNAQQIAPLTVSQGINELTQAYRVANNNQNQGDINNIKNIAAATQANLTTYNIQITPRTQQLLTNMINGARLGGADPPVDSSRNLTSFNQAIIVGAITMILVLVWSLFGSSKRTVYDDQMDYADQLDYDETYNSQIDEYEYYNHENHDGINSYYYDDDSTDYNGYYNAETYGDNNGQYESEYDEKNNEYLSNNYKNIDLDFIKYDQYGHGYAYYADLY